MSGSIPFPFYSGSKVMLFTDKSIDPRSLLFFVPPSNGILLKAWGAGHDSLPKPTTKPKPPNLNLQKKKKKQFIIVEMVLTTDPKVPFYKSEDACCDECAFLFPEIEIMDETCVMQCGMWALFHKQNVLALTVPGLYRLRLSSNEAVGEIFIEAMRLSADDISVLPQGILLGNW